MVEIGTKAIVLASSFNNSKKIGPRYGSIGYPISLNGTTFITGINSKNSFWTEAEVGIVDILFIRYGTNKPRTTAERRAVIGLIPMVRGSRLGQDTATCESDLLSSIKKFQKEDFADKKWHYVKAGKLGAYKDSPVCILAPQGCYGDNLITCDATEFNAWLESMIWSNLMTTCIRNVCKPQYIDRFPFSADQKDMLKQIRLCFSSKTRKKEFLLNIEGENVRKDIVKVLMAIKITALHDLYARQVAEMGKSLDSGVYTHAQVPLAKQPEVLFRLFARNLFIKPLFDYKKKFIIEYSNFKTKTEMIKGLEVTRDTLLKLADNLY